MNALLPKGHVAAQPGVAADEPRGGVGAEPDASRLNANSLAGHSANGAPPALQALRWPVRLDRGMLAGRTEHAPESYYPVSVQVQRCDGRPPRGRQADNVRIIRGPRKVIPPPLSARMV